MLSVVKVNVTVLSHPFSRIVERSRTYDCPRQSQNGQTKVQNPLSQNVFYSAYGAKFDSKSNLSLRKYLLVKGKQNFIFA